MSAYSPDIKSRAADTTSAAVSAAARIPFCVCVPARNEEERLPRLLEALAAQDIEGAIQVAHARSASPRAGIEPSVGNVGASYDNALAETINGLYTAELIHRRGPWRSL